MSCRRRVSPDVCVHAEAEFTELEHLYLVSSPETGIVNRSRHWS